MVAESESAPAGARRAAKLLVGLLAAGSVGAVLLLAALCVNHIGFPLHLDLMEGAVLQHVERAAAGEPIYPAPTPDYVPLAYNVLYYYACVPFTWVLGLSLPTLRLVSILATFGVAAVLFASLRTRGSPSAWALFAAGLFAAAYRTMDAYLDTAHSDACMLLCAVTGTWILQRSRSRSASLAGVALLVLAFWFKQHGAWFAIGGVCFLTWRDGWRASVPYWALAALAGPATYLLAGPSLFGSHYHEITLLHPSQWSTIDRNTVRRMPAFFVANYPLLLLASIGLLVHQLRRPRARLDVWTVQLAFAAVTAGMGSLDPGSSDNVFIPFGTFLIAVGVAALCAWSRNSRLRHAEILALIAVLASFVPLRYDPRRVWLPARAGASYEDLLATLRGLDGPVYAPTIGSLGQDFALQPSAHWVPVFDLVRGPGRDLHGQPIVAELLRPALEPERQAYVLSHEPLDGFLGFLGLAERYRLQTDFGERFRPLAPLPCRWEHGWPRYLYVADAIRRPEPPPRDR
jgi:hypothetical protein